MNGRTLILVLAIVGIVIAGLQLSWTPAGQTSAKSTHSSLNATPDLIVEEPVMEHFDASGELAWRAHGKTLQHYESTGTSHIEQPDALIRPKKDKDQAEGATEITDVQLENSDPWRLTSNTAALTQNQTHIALNGNARVSNSEMLIESEQILMDTQRQYATSDKAVTITAHGATAHADGLEADLSNKTLRLPARVKEIHEAPKRKK